MENSDRRDGYRVRTLKSVRLVMRDKTTLLSGMLRNFSGEGAHIKMGEPGQVPNRFDLDIMGETIGKLPCRVVWRKPDSLGVRFIIAPKSNRI